MIHLDTSALIGALTGRRTAAPALRQLIADGHRMAIATLVLYEWRRGPRTSEEIADQEQFVPAASAVPFGPREAAAAADLYARIPGARRREIDIAIAACAIAHCAALWTLNPRDFADIPGLDIVIPRRR
jgi:predicted nucleic acid-binding protein